MYVPPTEDVGTEDDFVLTLTDEPMKLGDGDLFNIMMRARGLGITTMIHAENNDMIEQITKYGHSDVTIYLKEKKLTSPGVWQSRIISELSSTP